jgi:hypothetical protein
VDSWPTHRPNEALAIPEGSERHDLRVTLDPSGQVLDVSLDGQSVWPGWFKLEWKGNGQMSAKAAGIRLSTRYGDRISIRITPDVPPPEQG